ncbi:unnamed protein product [Lathyrus sativus]|nr:unnamed protein product [Lathyrus sativus]
MLKLGNGEDFSPKYGIWNFDNNKFVQPVKIVSWVVVNFSAKWDVQGLVRDLTKCGGMKGIDIEQPLGIYEEETDVQFSGALPVERVTKIVEACSVQTSKEFCFWLYRTRTACLHGNRPFIRRCR